MFEQVLQRLPEVVRACRRLYDPVTGGYHVPPRPLHHAFGLADVEALRRRHPQLQYDCVEVPVADLLASLVINTHSRLVLETGTSRGFSTAHLAAAAHCVHGDRARVVTIDPAPTPHPMFERSPLASVIRPQPVDSLGFDAGAAFDGEAVDFMLLDSLHTYDHLASEAERFLPNLAVGGLLALHDTFFFDGLGLVTLALMQLPGLESLSMPTHRRHGAGLRSPGVSLFRKLAPMAPGSVRLPRGPGLPQGERATIRRPREFVAAFGAVPCAPHYLAHELADTDRRRPEAPALLAPKAGVGAPCPPSSAHAPVIATVD